MERRVTLLPVICVPSRTPETAWLRLMINLTVLGLWIVFFRSILFVEHELFDRHCTKLKGTDKQVDYVSICTPNYLHDAHMRYGLRLGTDVICEKPLVLNPWNVDALEEVEKETGHHIYTILQLRLHQSIIDLKKKIENGPKDKIYDVDLTYITSRGNWYYTSWKGDVHKSGELRPISACIFMICFHGCLVL